MSDPQRLQDGILPNFTHFPPQPIIQGFPVHPIQQQPSNLFAYQQPPYYPTSFPQYNPYTIPHNGQHNMTFPTHPYMGIPMPNPTYYQSLPVPLQPQSPFNDLKGSILPHIRPVYDPYVQTVAKPPGYRAEIERLGNRIARPTRKEAAVTIQSHWRGYKARKQIHPILKLSKHAIQRENNRAKKDLAESVCRSVAGDVINQAVEVMVTNFVLDWLEYRAYLILLDLECFVIRDKIIDEVIGEKFIHEIIHGTLLEVIAEDMYKDLIEEETKDLLIAELSLPRNREEMRRLTLNDIHDTMLESGMIDQLIFSAVVGRLDPGRHDFAHSKEMEAIQEQFILDALVSLFKNSDS